MFAAAACVTSATPIGLLLTEFRPVATAGLLAGLASVAILFANSKGPRAWVWTVGYGMSVFLMLIGLVIVASNDLGSLVFVVAGGWVLFLPQPIITWFMIKRWIDIENVDITQKALR